MEKYTLITGLGEITGVVLKDGIEFRGLRYARAKRWHAPELVTGWEGNYDAFSTFGKKCYQHHWDPQEFYGKEFYTKEAFEVPESEDCLFMTVPSIPRNFGMFSVPITAPGGP